MRLTCLIVSLCCAALFRSAAAMPGTPEESAPAQDNTAQNRNSRAMTALIENEMRIWGQQPPLPEALEAHNARTEGMTASELKSLDALWRSELKKAHKSLITNVTENPAADYLRRVRDNSGGLYTEIVLIDARGLAVAMTGIAEKYNYSGERFWEKTVAAENALPYIGDTVFSDDTMLFQTVAVLPLVQNETITGVIYAGIDPEALEERY